MACAYVYVYVCALTTHSPFAQVEDVAPEEVKKKFEHHHEWDACPLVAEPVDSQEPVKEGEVGWGSG